MKLNAYSDIWVNAIIDEGRDQNTVEAHGQLLSVLASNNYYFHPSDGVLDTNTVEPL